MQINSFNKNAAATAVWSSTTRTLTSAVGSIIITSQGFAVVVPTATIVDLRPPANTIREITIGVTASPTGSSSIGFYNGTTFTATANIASGAIGMQHASGNSVVGVSMKNNDVTNTSVLFYVIKDNQ